MSTMRSNRPIDGLGPMSNFYESSHAAASGDVSLAKSDAARCDHLLELVKRVQILARRDRQSSIAHNSPMAFDIVGYGRLFKPVDGKLGKPARGSDRLVNAPAHIGVDHQRKVGAEMIAHRSDPIEILRKARPAYLHLDRAESLFEVIVGLMQQLIQRKIEIDATSVGRHARVMTAEQP